MAEFADACHSPSFLKKITEMPMSTLNLPSSFVRTHSRLLNSNVTLEGPSRKHWKVGVDGSFESFSVSFGQGFQNFVADHVLQLGDQLCFILPAHSHFQVQVQNLKHNPNLFAIGLSNLAFRLFMETLASHYSTFNSCAGL